VIHGRNSTYVYRGCRCRVCTDVHAAYDLAAKHRRYERTAANGGIAPVAVHNRATYTNWGCHCYDCYLDASTRGSEDRQRRKVAAS
jgi:hypothetical protein